MSKNKAMTEPQLKVFGECYSGGKKMEAIMYGNMSFGNFVYIEEWDMHVDWEEFKWGLTDEEKVKFSKIIRRVDDKIRSDASQKTAK